jgi:hypothetical protein
MKVLWVCLALAQSDPELSRLRAEHMKKLQEIRADVASLEAKVAVVRRMVPPQFEADIVEPRIQALAAASEIDRPALNRVPAPEKVLLANGGATPYERVVLELSGEADFSSLGFFLDRLGRLPLIVELETLSLDAAPLGAVRYVGRFGFPVYTGWPDSAAGTPPSRPFGSLGAPQDERSARERRVAAERELFRHMEAAAAEPVKRLQAEIFAISEMRRERAPARFHAALARFETEMQRTSLVLTRARFGPTAVVEGVAVGAPARAALRSAFQKAGFVVEKLDVAPAGDCRAFSLTARLAPREEPAVLDVPSVPVGPSRFDSRPAASCTAAPAPHRGNAMARGPAGAVTLHVREIDLADVFNLLAQLTGASFVVDANVKGRLNVDFQRSTLDEALAALRTAGVSVGPGPLRRVSMGTGTVLALSRSGSREETISLSFKSGVLLDVLRLFQEITGLKMWTAPMMDGRVNVFATEVPWDTALEGMAASVGMTAVFEFEAERLFVGPPAMAQAPWRSGAVEVTRAKNTDDDPSWSRITELTRMGTDDLTLVGVAHTPEGLKAVAYGPGRLLWLLQPGVKLFEATVEAVDAAAVTFAGTDGRKTALRFAP